MSLLPSEFSARWRAYARSERGGAQSHFLDLCEMLGQDHPAAVDAVGEKFSFEKHVGKTRGGKGYADVWLRDHFAWEYKGKHKDLDKAYQQLNDYREDLGNPPLLVVCDLERFRVHTNFTATSKRVYEFTLDDLAPNQVTRACPLPPLDVLRALFGDYNILRPNRTDAQVTQEVAKKFAKLAEQLETGRHSRDATREEVAKFLMRILFCLFADSIGLLPNHLFRRIVQEDRYNPRKFWRKLENLFGAMSHRESTFGEHSIKYFNGDLFNSGAIIPLQQPELDILYDVTKNYDWSHVAPAIFGTLFERSFDSKRRSLIGAHYTSEDDIHTLIEPVLIRPLERRWREVQRNILQVLETECARNASRSSKQLRLSILRRSEDMLGDWIQELTAIRILDPACGSGNFLYVSLRRMLDLWLAARNFAVEQGISLSIPKIVSPSQLYGIETEFYAHELASVVVWIGLLQWKHEHGLLEDHEPILEKLTGIARGDAILRRDANGKACEPSWPEADFIVGNPPFLGGSKMRHELGNTYVDALHKLYAGRVPAAADLVTYWFEKARTEIRARPKTRVGLLATQAIRGGVNRRVLESIKLSGEIFMAWDDRPWLLEGAVVHVSMVGFDGGGESERTLNGELVSAINPDLTQRTDATSAKILPENSHICFRTNERGGPFDIEPAIAAEMLVAPKNVNGMPNSAVLRRFVNAADITGRSREMWIIDFCGLSESEAAKFEMPFETLKQRITEELEATRCSSRPLKQRDRWWLHRRPGSEMREATANLSRYIVTIRVGKHRPFLWLDHSVVPDSSMYAFAREDDYFLGVLHSEVHEIWARATGTQVRDAESGFRYTPTSCFETFPFPWPPGTEPCEKADPRVRAIANAARELVHLRDEWLNPNECSQEKLSKRTLTRLYNERPGWLANAHRVLDEAVFAAYGWSSDLTREEILGRLLELNHDRAAGRVRVQATIAPPKRAPQSEKPGNWVAPRGIAELSLSHPSGTRGNERRELRRRR